MEIYPAAGIAFAFPLLGKHSQLQIKQLWGLGPLFPLPGQGAGSSDLDSNGKRDTMERASSVIGSTLHPNAPALDARLPGTPAPGAPGVFPAPLSAPSRPCSPLSHFSC